MGFFRVCAVFLLVCYSALSQAAGVFESVGGAVTVAGRGVSKGDAFGVGSRVETGKGASAVLRFEDGQAVVLGEQAVFDISDYRYEKASNEGVSSFALLRGGLRYISGLLARTRPDTFKLTTPVATIGIRGTDFMAVSGSLYLSVTEGLVSATNAAGSSSFAAGQMAVVPTSATLPAPIAATGLPANVAAAFSQLGSIPVAPLSVGGGIAGEGAAGAAVGGVGAGTIAIGAVVAGALAGAMGGGGGGGGASSTSTATATAP